jgi:hypothetical protein
MAKKVPSSEKKKRENKKKNKLKREELYKEIASQISKDTFGNLGNLNILREKGEKNPTLNKNGVVENTTVEKNSTGEKGVVKSTTVVEKGVVKSTTVVEKGVGESTTVVEKGVGESTTVGKNTTVVKSTTVDQKNDLKFALFFQKKMMNFILSRELDNSNKVLLTYLFSLEGIELFLSTRYLMKVLNMSSKTVTKALKELESRGYISRNLDAGKVQKINLSGLYSKFLEANKLPSDLLKDIVGVLKRTVGESTTIDKTTVGESTTVGDVSMYVFNYIYKNILTNNSTGATVGESTTPKGVISLDSKSYVNLEKILRFAFFCGFHLEMERSTLNEIVKNIRDGKADEIVQSIFYTSKMAKKTKIKNVWRYVLKTLKDEFYTQLTPMEVEKYTTHFEYLNGFCERDMSEDKLRENIFMWGSDKFYEISSTFSFGNDNKANFTEQVGEYAKKLSKVKEIVNDFKNTYRIKVMSYLEEVRYRDKLKKQNAK